MKTKLSTQTRELLESALADANALKMVSLASAKQQISEEFAPRVQSMYAAQLYNEVEGDEEETATDEPVDGEESTEVEPTAEPEVSPEGGESEEAPVATDEPIDEPVDGEELPADTEEVPDEEADEYAIEYEEEEDVQESSDDDLSYDSIIDELDAEDVEDDVDTSIEDIDSIGDESEVEVEESTEDFNLDQEVDRLKNEDLSLNSVSDDEEIEIVDDEEKISEITEENKSLRVKVNSLQNENKKLTEAILHLKKTINEAAILNHKLLYSGRIFKEFNLNEDQKIKVVESFDRAKTNREVKLVYTTIVESFKRNSIKESKKRATKITESVRKVGGASAPTGNTRTIVESKQDNSNDIVNASVFTRMSEVAGIRKN